MNSNSITYTTLTIVNRRTAAEIQAAEALDELLDLAHRIQAATGLDEIAALICARHQHPELEELLSNLRYRYADEDADSQANDDGDHDDSWDAA